MAHKYKAQPVVIDGVRFASKAEGRRYQELKLLEKAGEICNLELHPRFVLTVENGDYPNNLRGRTIDIGAYVADFRYYRRVRSYAKGQMVVEDVKGMKTTLYRWKKRHVEAQYGITITEVSSR